MRRAPRAIFDYVDRGSYDEHTLNGNRRALDALAEDKKRRAAATARGDFRVNLD